MKDDKKVKDEHGRTLKAGGVVVRKHEGGLDVVLVFRPSKADWQFPKGHVAEGETFEEAAIREVTEETGLSAQVIKQLPPLSYETRWIAEPVTCYMFLMTADADEFPENTDERPEWVPLANVRDRLSKENLKEYFDNIQNEILSS